LVQEMLDDPSINLTLLLTAIKAQMYKSTIKLTLNLVYSLLGSLDGMPLLAHELKLSRTTASSGKLLKTTKQLMEDSKQINDKVLELVADRLLANPTINSSLVPDAVERQIYINCLKVVFRLLEILSNSFRVTICGHDFRLALEPAQLERSAMAASSSLSLVNLRLVADFAREAGIDEDSTEGFGWWDRLWIRRKIMAHHNTVLYGLVLGILDDIMANTKIQILSDDIVMDIVPPRPKPKQEHQQQQENTTQNESLSTHEEESVSVGSFAVASFAAGMGMGVAVMALLTSPR
jgi:hypothetical protein